MVGERGFEPPTPWSRTRCSTRLSHSPTVFRFYYIHVGMILARAFPQTKDDGCQVNSAIAIAKCWRASRLPRNYVEDWKSERAAIHS